MSDLVVCIEILYWHLLKLFSNFPKGINKEQIIIINIKCSVGASFEAMYGLNIDLCIWFF